MRFLKLSQEEPGFQMAPMIDVVFQLLIFFMCASSFFGIEAQLNINLPTVATTVPTKIAEEVIINILSDGSIMVNEKQYDSPESKGLPELVAMLTSLAEIFESQPVIIFADWDVPHEKVINVLNACTAAKIKSVSFLVPEETIQRMSGKLKM